MLGKFLINYLLNNLCIPKWRTKLHFWGNPIPGGIYVLYIYRENTRTICEICSLGWKINNKDIRTTSLTSFWCLYWKLWTIFIHCYGVAIYFFEQVDAGWDDCRISLTDKVTICSAILILQDVFLTEHENVIYLWSLVYLPFPAGEKNFWKFVIIAAMIARSRESHIHDSC